MRALFSNLLTASVSGSIVILAVLVLRLVLRKTPKKFICILWMVAGLRLLLPVPLQSRFSLQPPTIRLPQSETLQTYLVPLWCIVAVSPMCFLVRRNAFVPLAEGESLAVDLAQWCMARMQEGMRHVYTPHCVVKADAESAFEGFRVKVPAGWYDPCATGSKRA